MHSYNILRWAAFVDSTLETSAHTVLSPVMSVPRITRSVTTFVHPLLVQSFTSSVRQFSVQGLPSSVGLSKRHQTDTSTLPRQRTRAYKTPTTVTPYAALESSGSSRSPKHSNDDRNRRQDGEQNANNTQPKFLRPATKGALSTVSVVTPVINWYPGHIAKAERTLKDSIKLVDVVIEVRDCRIPISTAHPSVPEWIGSRSHVIALSRADLAPDAARAAWRNYFAKQGSPVRFVDAKRGRGVKELKKVAIQAGAEVNNKRKKKGLLPRPVRCLVMGYPNVGKSALINKLVGRNTAKSANKPGVTRNFQWIRISESIELLDMPGIIPAKFVSQDKAIRLAICDDIGQAAYDHQVVAALMIDELKQVIETHPQFFDFETLKKRFGIDPADLSGEYFLYEAAKRVSRGDLERTAVRLLTELRSGTLGPVAFEAPDMLPMT